MAATVATQVWLGYLVARYQDKQWKPKSMGGAISIDIGTAKIAFGYAEAQECPGKSLPIVRSYDLTKLIKQTDSAGICKELDKIIEVMDVRHSDSATQVLDPEFRDFKVKYLAFINSDDGIKAAILEAHMQMYSAGALTEHKSWLKIAAAVYKHDDTYGMYADEAIEKARRHKARDAEAVLLRKIAEYHYRFEMSDFDRLYGLCERLVQYLATVFDTLESTYGVQLTGKEPVFFFGTMHMRKWLKDSERNHGSRCYELLGTMETFLNVFLKRKLKPDQGDGENRYYGQEHTVKLEICSQSDEATYEHKAFLAAFASSKVDTIETECEDEDVDGKKTLFEALQDNLVGNLAYGKGSMQGVPNGKTNINCELGLHRIMQCIEEESINYGGVVFLDQKKKKRVSFDPATCNSIKCDSFIRACQQRIIDDLKILSPQLLWDDTWLKIQRPPMTFTSEIEEGLQEHHHVNIEDAFQNIEEAFQ